MENQEVQQAIKDMWKLYYPNIEELSEQDREIEILKIKWNCMENELAWIKKRLAEIEEENAVY